MAGIFGGRSAGDVVCLYVVVFFLLLSDEPTCAASTAEGNLSEDCGGFGIR